MEKWEGTKEVYYKGKNDIYRAYKGEELLWQKEYTNTEYLVIECVYESVIFKYETDGNKSPKFYVSKLTKEEAEQGITPTSFENFNLNQVIYLYEGEKLYIYGDNQKSISNENNHFMISRIKTTGNDSFGGNWNDYTNNGQVKIYGNLKALTNKEIPYLQYDYEFYGLFKNNTTIVDCSELVLPFGSKYMAFKKLFYGCQILGKTPIIPNVEMKNEMYEGMFYGCPYLEEITCLTYSPSTDACFMWLYDAGKLISNPTFYKKKGVEWTIGDNGIPSRFNIVEV